LAVTTEVDPAVTASTVTVTVRYFAAARAAAGIDEESVTVPAPAAVDAVVRAIAERHGDKLERVLARCSYLLNATAVRDRSAAVGGGDEIDVLPPFAGG
jgi:molybdopterin converting factor small subunit